MKKIDENFYGYIRVEGDTYTYNVSDNIVTLLPAQSDPQKRDDSLYRIKSHKTDTPLFSALLVSAVCPIETVNVTFSFSI